MDDKKVDDKTYLCLYTVYEIDVTDSYKKVESNKMHVCVGTGFEGYKEAEQRDLMKSAGIYNENTGIQVLRDFEHLQIGQSYLFLTVDLGGTYNYIVNPDQFAFDKSVAEKSETFGYLEIKTFVANQKQANNVKKEIDPEDYLVSHIQIKSGDNTIFPFGSLMWSETDHGDGFVDIMHADYVEVTDMVKRCADIIPKIVLDESVSYLVQVNGRVENVCLLTPNEDGYTKSENTFDALSNLEDGTYYVAFEVLLSGNCDPDAPQNSSRYQDIFCLVVGEDDKPATSDMISYSSGDVLSQTVLNNAEKQIVLNILNSDREWCSEIPACDWICKFSGSINVGYCDCGTLSDIENNRSRKLTTEERELLEDLISHYNADLSHSG